MFLRILAITTVVMNLNSTRAFAAPSTPTPQEYEVVRKIALRDPKVKAAFENANQRLEAKIIEIDPSLRGHVKGPTTPLPAKAKPVAESSATLKPFAKKSGSAAPTMHGSTHLIATGDTLSSIAARYKITVAELKAANPKVNETKLQVGQKVTLPSGHQQRAEVGSTEPSAWQRLKRKF